MFVKTQFNGTLVNLDNVESIRTERPAEHTVIIEAETPQGARYNLATTATRKEADEIINTITKSLAEGAPIFDLEEYTAARMEREAGKRAAETRNKYKREYWAATQGRKVEKSDNGGALDWEAAPADWDNEIAEETAAENAAANLDYIWCKYPNGAKGVLFTQDGEQMYTPANWEKIWAEPTPEGTLAITLDYHKPNGELRGVIIGVYSPDRIDRIFRDLRDAIENQRDCIKMPEE